MRAGIFLQLCAVLLFEESRDSLAEGASRSEILGSYPSLRPEHIDAAREHLPRILQLSLEGRLVVVTGTGIRAR